MYRGRRRHRPVRRPADLARGRVQASRVQAVAARRRTRVVGSLPASITDPIVADAATRLGVIHPRYTIVEAKAETFSDGSSGAPNPG